MLATVWAVAVTLAAGGGLTTGDVELVAKDFMFTEGPVWMPDGTLLFSDIPADTIYRMDKTVFRKPSGQSNGLALDTEGRLLACEHQTRRVTRTEKDGAITVLAERFEGKRLNSPNDLVMRSDGTLFFTDPPYGLGSRGLESPDAELDFSGVYSISPDGKLTVLVRDFKKPNGIALSPDEKTLYVADTEGSHLRAFAVAEDGSLDKGRVLCEIPGPDGMAMDAKGNVWATGRMAVFVFNPAGEQIGQIEIPQSPANCTFGGPDGKTLYVTARTGLFKVQTSIAGLRPPSK